MGETGRRARIVVGLLLVAASSTLPTRIAAAGAREEPSPSGDFNDDGFHDLAVGIPDEDVGDLDDAGAVEVIYGTAQGLDGDLPIDDQFWHQDSSGISESAEPEDGFGSALAWGDYDGDGYDDLAIGVPFEDVPTSAGELADAGAVHVLYGSSSGLTASDDQYITQNATGITDQVEVGDRFGAALAGGDLNGNGAADLAIGVPREDPSASNAGAVSVLYGNPTSGFQSPFNQLWHQDSPGIAGVAESGDEFGTALVIANFVAGSTADLVVGSPAEDIGSAGAAGNVNVIYGSSSGLTSTGNRLWNQDSGGIAGQAETSDRFGESLAAANLGNSAEADLAIGVPVENAAGTNDGAVQVIYGSSTGLTSAGSQMWHSATPGVPGDADDDDFFGTAVAAGNFGKSTHADLAIGVPGNDLGDSDAGAAVVLYGSSSGLTTSQAQYWTQDSQSIRGETEIHDRFGEELAAANFGRTFQADLAIGAPGEATEDIFGLPDDNFCGAVNVIFGTDTGLSNAGNQFWWQASDTLHDSAEDLDHFGAVLA